jgi:hypothetical protein
VRLSRANRGRRIRYRWKAANAGFAIRDPSTGYIVTAGLPTPPSSITLCGGTMPFQASSELTEGELKGVLHDLRMGSDLNVLPHTRPRTRNSIRTSCRHS